MKKEGEKQVRWTRAAGRSGLLAQGHGANSPQRRSGIGLAASARHSAGIVRPSFGPSLSCGQAATRTGQAQSLAVPDPSPNTGPKTSLSLCKCLRTHLGAGEARSGTLSLGAWLVLVQEAEELRALVLGEGLGELVDGRRHLEALVQDLALALDLDVAGPLQLLGEVAVGLHIAADAVRARGRRAKRVALDLGGRLPRGLTFARHGEELG